ncbi:hypothetical protein QJQ45_013599, partial [Haematococcus lacustris]
MFSAFDVLMGSDWLQSNGALLDYLARTVTLQMSANKTVLKCEPAAPILAPHCAHILAKHSHATVSAKVAYKWLRKGGQSLVALISSQPVNLTPPPANLLSVHPTPSPANLLSNDPVPHTQTTTSPPDTPINYPTNIPHAVAAQLTALISEFEDVFAPFNKLPPQRPVGHTIPLQPGCKPPALPSYKMSQPELLEMKKQVAAFLEQGIIEPSSSPYAAPVLFVKKKSGELRMCVDYRQLNKITLRDQYPLPRVDDLFDRLAGCTVFSSLDLQAGYHQIRIPDEDVPKTAFRTPTGLYQFKVLCFGLTNAPATFQRVMNNAFADVINDCALVYIDDILIMSKSVPDHFNHLRRVLELLRKHQFQAKLSKCEFLKTALKFLGHIVSDQGIAVDPDKVKSITSWPVPRSLTAMQQFLGAANFVRKFVHNFSALAAPLTDLTGKVGIEFNWHKWPDDKLQAFDALKHAISKVPLLKIPDITKPFQVYCDASLQGVGAVLMQEGYPLAYLSKKLIPAEKNYTTGEQELLAIITACKEWRCYLEGVPFTLYTDHKPLVALKTQKVLSRRQTRWLEFLSRYNFTIEYLPGDTNPADPLSRIPDAPVTNPVMVMTRSRKRLLEGEEATVQQQQPVMQQPQQEPQPQLVLEQPLPPPPVPLHPLHAVIMTEQLLAAYAADEAFASMVDQYDQDQHGLYRTRERNQIVVPNCPELKTRILVEMHDAQFAGHVGITKTLERISRMFWWPRMRSEVRHYVANCDACQRNKSVNTKPGGLLTPLAIPYDRWESISMDLITKLPPGEHGFDAIAVFVDRLSKMVHFVPCRESMNAESFARLFIDNVFKHHGVPREIISDRGSHFTNHFWASIMTILGVKECKSSAYHPQSDGQTERYNRTLEEMLRHYISPAQSDWPFFLSLAEFAVNNSWQESIQSTPFLVNTGQSPLTPALLELPGEVYCPTARRLSEWWQSNVKQARHFMELAQRRQAYMANKGRQEVEYHTGQLVLLSTKNLRMKPGKAKKLLPRFIGPFKVLEHVGPVAVRLDLPQAMARMHPVFHVSLLRPYTSEHPHLPPPVEWLDEAPLYEVEKLLAHRGVRAGKARGYLVKWQGYDDSYNTWEPRNNLVNCLEEYVLIYDVRMKCTHEQIMSRGAPFIHGWSQGEPRVVGCHAQPLLPLLLQHLDARLAHLVPVYHSFMYGLLKHQLEWFMSADGLHIDVRREIVKRGAAIQSPSDLGRDLGDLANRTGWRMEDYKHWFVHFSPIVLRGNLLPEPYRGLWTALEGAMLHYLTPGSENRATPAGMAAGYAHLKTYAARLERCRRDPLLPAAHGDNKDKLSVPTDQVCPNLHTTACRLYMQESNVGRTCLFGELWIERDLHDLKSITTSGIPGAQLDAHIAMRVAGHNASQRLLHRA